MLETLLHNPRRLFVRRALFQVHLWAGIFLSVYLIVIALTGAVLVFEDEFKSKLLPPGLHTYDPGHVVAPTEVVGSFAAMHPGLDLVYLTVPTTAVPAYLIEAKDAQQHESHFVADPVTAAIIEQPRTWLDVVRDLHVYLLLGETWGIRLNGFGAATLLVLAATGAVLWWPGMRLWMRGLRVSFRHSWKRINYDTHSAIGFWTLAIVTWWAFSGMYFAWYRQVGFVVNSVSALKNMLPPEPASAPVHVGAPVSLETILATAQKASPEGRLGLLSNATLHEPQVTAYMDRAGEGDFSHRDVVTLDRASGAVLSVWHYGQNKSLGDWVLWAMHPLHFGTLWGMAFKVLWCGFGLSLAVLTFTGLLMYWNRYLGKRWRALRG